MIRKANCHCVKNGVSADKFRGNVTFLTAIDRFQLETAGNAFKYLNWALWE